MNRNKPLPKRVRPLIEKPPAISRIDAEVKRSTPPNHLDPDWSDPTDSYDWRWFISRELKGVWRELSPEQRMVTAQDAQALGEKQHRTHATLT